MQRISNTGYDGPTDPSCARVHNLAAPPRCSLMTVYNRPNNIAYSACCFLNSSCTTLTFKREDCMLLSATLTVDRASVRVCLRDKPLPSKMLSRNVEFCAKTPTGDGVVISGHCLWSIESSVTSQPPLFMRATIRPVVQRSDAHTRILHPP